MAKAGTELLLNGTEIRTGRKGLNLPAIEGSLYMVLELQNPDTNPKSIGIYCTADDELFGSLRCAGKTRQLKHSQIP